MPGFLASLGEEFNPGPVTKLDHSELLCRKVLLKYKREKASDIDIRRGQKECPPRSSLAGCYIATSSLLIIERNGSRPLTHKIHGDGTS